ncbi:hypothetical protein FOXG_04766 [Fusarium oxysporum f. sp. lycopersici 4287]|uniref:Uncharacterized protein n=1 Tax=Fusarium oxysporum f. sp. lycopersici (strain 4287 / CBS 123668 / FGSC 9935 / NRRL 34936) TaxID=426428 RepID=A0A0J9URF3_FUSO4|nr:hypothetical protein FOXG_04766 [Fusarium oxysporum f. sp. lycopersici 4287]KNB01548.1 hypothetical protein FOXG_04766 [Fusarium oxysporum f. sp. lycopersici 4287]
MWMDKHMCLCIYQQTGSGESLASTFLQYLYLKGARESRDDA